MRDPWILFRHILPNCLAPIIVTTTLGIATSIIVEATLSFLGLGTQPPTPSWGWDLKANVAFIQANVWLSLFPGLAIFVTVLGFNLFGDGLRDAARSAAEVAAGRRRPQRAGGEAPPSARARARWESARVKLPSRKSSVSPASA